MRRFNTISILRVVACILIVLGHYSSYFGVTILKKLLPEVGMVAIFFVISGFLAFCEYDNNPNPRKYYYKRIKRIVPPYYFVLFACIIANCRFNYIQGNMGIVDWMRYFSFLNLWIPSSDFGIYNNLFGFWTMTAFMFFYFITPFLYKNMKMVSNVIVLIFVSMLFNVVYGKIITFIQIENAWEFKDLNPLSVLYLYVLGLATGYAYCRNQTTKIITSIGAVMLIALICRKSGYIFWGVTTAILCLVPSLNIPKCLSEKKSIKVVRKIVLFFDTNSFNIYLWHMLVATIVIEVINENSIVQFCVSLILSIFISHYSRKLLNTLISSKSIIFK